MPPRQARAAARDGGPEPGADAARGLAVSIATMLLSLPALGESRSGPSGNPWCWVGGWWGPPPWRVLTRGPSPPQWEADVGRSCWQVRCRHVLTSAPPACFPAGVGCDPAATLLPSAALASAGSSARASLPPDPTTTTPCRRLYGNNSLSRRQAALALYHIRHHAGHLDQPGPICILQGGQAQGRALAAVRAHLPAGRFDAAGHGGPHPPRAAG
jgi:hypothetical protein